MTLSVSSHRARVPPGAFPAEFFLEVVSGVEGLIQPECLFKAFFFSFLFVKMIRPLEEKPPRSFEDILLKLVGGFPVKVSAKSRQLVVEELHHMEMIKDNGGPGEMVHDSAYVCGRHIDGNGFDPCPGMAQLFPERFQCLCPFPITHKYDSATVQIENDGHIAVSFLDRNLINGHMAEVLERRMGELLLQMPFLDILDGIPGDAQVPGHIQDCHVLRKVQGIPLKGPGIGEAGIGEAELYLADRRATPARYPLDVEIKKDHLRSYRNRAEPPL